MQKRRFYVKNGMFYSNQKIKGLALVGTGGPIFFILALVSIVYALCIGIAHMRALERGILGDESEWLNGRSSGPSSKVESG